MVASNQRGFQIQRAFNVPLQHNGRKLPTSYRFDALEHIIIVSFLHDLAEETSSSELPHRKLERLELPGFRRSEKLAVSGYTSYRVVCPRYADNATRLNICATPLGRATVSSTPVFDLEPQLEHLQGIRSDSQTLARARSCERATRRAYLFLRRASEAPVRAIN